MNIPMTVKKEILIVGVDGVIGSALKKALILNNFLVKGTSRRKNRKKDIYFLDLEKPNFKIINKKFDSVIICAGITSLNFCQKYPKKCELVNVLSIKNLIDYALAKGSFVVYLSSNSVFDGSKAFYKRTDITNPQFAFGRHQVNIEEHINRKLNHNACVLRMTKIISKKTRFIKCWESDAAKNYPIKAYTNKYLSPIDINIVIDTILLLIKRKQQGIFQLSGSEEISFYKFAQLYFKNFPQKFKLIKPEIMSRSEKNLVHNSLETYLPTKEGQYDELLNVSRLPMGLMSGHAYLNDPKRLAFTLSRYKFVSKMFAGFENVLEVGCADAFASSVVLKEVKKFVACDFDALFIDDAKRNHPFKKQISFEFHNMIDAPMKMKFKGVFSLDVLEHINKNNEDKFMRNICASLAKNGVCIIGMPSLESQLYASEISKLGHVNCKTGFELKSFLSNYFEHVFIFSMNDEVVHTGYHSMAQYLLALCCSPIK